MSHESTPDTPACCAPSAGRDETSTRHERRAANGAVGAAMARIPAGTFTMGNLAADANLFDGEGPLRQVSISAFLLDVTAVPNEQFRRFVDDTGHVSTAERDGWSFVFGPFVPETLHSTARSVPSTPWWWTVGGACWFQPEGPGSTIENRPDHPVVHVSHDDAVAFASWAGKRLPTEAEWEYAARGGFHGATYPWGDELRPDDVWRCNIWQGQFPALNTAEDGHLGTAPVSAFEPNGYGLHQMIGNVWEWTADRWTTSNEAGPLQDPIGPTVGEERVRRGGSYLCHDSYCNRYRVAARDHSHPADTTANIGFRCAVDAETAETN